MDLSDISLASLSLDSYTCADFVCGSNGLPPTPNSIRIIGDFKARIERVEHENLIKYVECFRNKNERVTLVFEDASCKPPGPLCFKPIAKQLLDALFHLHNKVDCVHGLISPDCIRWSRDNKLKLAHWPINYLTGAGYALGASTILPHNVSFVAPELVRRPKVSATQQSDIWSAGLTLLVLLKPDCKIPENPCRLAFCDSAQRLLKLVDGLWSSDASGENDNDDDADDDEDNQIWNKFFHKALDPDPNSRGTLTELYSILGFSLPVRPTIPFEIPLDVDYFEKQQDKISRLSVAQVYHLWRLSLGRNFESEQKQDDCPPIFKVPYLIVNDKQTNTIGDFKLKNHIIIDTKSKLIPLDKFKSDINRLDERIFNPLILTNEDTSLIDGSTRSDSVSRSSISSGGGYLVECNNNRKVSKALTFADLDDVSIWSSIRSQINGSSKILPIVIKEADFAYQCERIMLFKRLLSGHPYLASQLVREASIDIPPYYRAQIWAILLDVCPAKSELLYEAIDKTTPVATDRQISVDIPRCHQYNELMASPQGHQKLARILKAWLNYNSKQYVYWQGLDSLAAPFLLLNFDNEAMAFACFNAFVNKYLRGFFKKDNHDIVQQYLSMFSELLSYHDASLASHLERLSFLPDLYAIPWFLTMFTHVLPLHKILHVWDRLLLGDERFPLCIGLAILNQLRSELLEFSFNDCIVAFSDLPEIDIERCIRDASHYYNSTPDKLIDMSKIQETTEPKDAILVEID